MVQINKEEAMALRERYGKEVGIAITNKHKKGGRKRYYVEETNRTRYFLERFRERQLRKATKKKVN